VLVLLAYLRRRVSRGLAVASLGPNEARILFDLVVSHGALLAALAFRWGFMPSQPEGGKYFLLLMPTGLVIVNALLGIYSRLKRASGRTKGAVLTLSVACVCTVGWVVSADQAVVVLWGLLVVGPVVLARLLLGLPHSKHKNLASLAVNRRGPVLVIGGAGYVGSHTVDLLLKRGFKVRVLDRLMYGRESLAEFFGNSNFELVEGDATDITKVTTAAKNVSAVVHLAGLVGDPACAVDVQFTRHANVVATRMAKDVAQSLGVYRFIFASSCSVYGVSDREVSEMDALNPVSLYAQTKIDSERELLFSVRDDFFVTILRFATVFGHSRRPRFDLVANLFTAQAMTEGLITVTGPHQWRPFIHVRDLARAIVMVLEADPAVVQSQIYNVGDQRLNMTVLQLAQIVQSLAGRHREVCISVQNDQGDRRNYAVSFAKIRAHLGFEATILMEEGIREMVDKFLTGQYQDYREAMYSNVAMTRLALHEFYDPAELVKLYAPLKAS
jgi:nucleoside-diphosphate-sugar epimerase